MNLATFLLRVVQIGLRLEDLDDLEYGIVVDMMIEKANDSCEYRLIASQEDMNRF